jgi:hypothetical protein
MVLQEGMMLRIVRETLWMRAEGAETQPYQRGRPEESV